MNDSVASMIERLKDTKRELLTGLARFRLLQ